MNEKKREPTKTEIKENKKQTNTQTYENKKRKQN